MISITRQQLDLLVTLQENERQQERLQAERDRIPGRKAELEESLRFYEQQVQQKQEEIAALKKNYRARENELELNQSRIKKRQTQLNSVKTNRDYQSLLKEIDEIRSTNSRIEDASLQCLDEIDAAEKDLAAKQRAHDEEKERIEAQQQELENTARDLQDRIDQLTRASAGIEEQLDADLVRQYRQLRKRCGGVAIAPVENAVCKGCYLNIPPQMYNELQRENELRMCPHCHRLIYVL